MELETVGRVYYPGYQLLAHVVMDDDPAANQGLGMRFRAMLIGRGTGFVRIGGTRQPLIAPALICLNEREALGLEQPHDLSVQTLYFHPSVINSAFSFERARDGQGLSNSEIQDRDLFCAFLHREAGYVGMMPVGPVALQRLTSLYEMASQELTQQRDDRWPCRSRSYLLELLFVVDRVFHDERSARVPRPDEPLAQGVSKVDPVVLHLHTHYHEKMTIQALSRKFNTNRTTLEEQFRAATGVPVMAYLAALRIRIAATMLHDTQLPVSEVALRVGFKDTTHFGRMFRKYTGCSPSEYRTEYCWVPNS